MSIHESNPTTKSADRPSAAPSAFEIILRYDPAVGVFATGGNVSDPILYYGMLQIAQERFAQAQRQMEEAATRQAAARITLPSTHIGTGMHAVSKKIS